MRSDSPRCWSRPPNRCRCACASRIRAGSRFPIIVGGAAINRDFGRRIAFVDGERYFEPGVFYAKDAFEGLEIMDALTGDPQRRATSAASGRERPIGRGPRARRRSPVVAAARARP